MKIFDNAVKPDRKKLDLPGPSDDVDQILKLCSAASALAAQLPPLLSQGNSARHLVEPLASLLLKLKSYLVAHRDSPIPETIRSGLTNVLEKINESQRTANDWMARMSPELDKMARLRDMKRAYQKR